MKKVASLRSVAERVGLAPCSVSAVLNKTPASLAIPQRTKDRVFRAATELSYRPNFSARSLRTKRTHMVAAISTDFSRAPVARVVAGMERRLRQRGYLLILGAFDRASEWNSFSAELRQRGVEGVLAVDTSLPRDVELPVVSIDLGSLVLREPFADDVGEWLTELGGPAVEAVLRQIETKATPRKTNIVPKLPSASFELHGLDLPSGAGLGVQQEA